ncbi:MAG: sugar transferase, partial [Clostridia bacterium]|nr:sugar transferase [Clostridia bacterium]
MKKYFYIKCILDFIFALSAILVIWPILLIIAILIKLESKGPVFFLQERLGRNGSVFKIYKFRTMVDGAINLGSGLRTDEGDPRITKVGSFLRKTSLDELPQIFNILRGEMSFIGPRPPVPYYPRKYEDYSIEQKRRFMVRPGISGYAQVVLRNSGTWDERIKLDLEYVDRMSFLFD